MKPRAGRTISDVSGVYNDVFNVLYDFNSQYPGVKISHNICISTLLSPEQIKTARLVEGKDYVTYDIPNVYPQVFHVCPDSTKCNLKLSVAKSDFGKNCKWENFFKLCSFPAKFATHDLMEGIAGKCCKNLLAKRSKYKKLMAAAKKEGNLTDVVIFNQYQLVMKSGANSIFGIMLLLDSTVGGAITHLARMQNEVASEYFNKKSGPIAMADTDSTAPIASSLKLKWEVGDDVTDNFVESSTSDNFCVNSRSLAFLVVS